MSAPVRMFGYLRPHSPIKAHEVEQQINSLLAITHEPSSGAEVAA